MNALLSWRFKRYFIFFLLSISGVLLSGCTEEITVRLLEDEKWELERVISYKSGLFPELSVGMDIFAGFGLGMDIDGLDEAAFEMMVSGARSYYASQGIDTELETRNRRGEVQYIITGSAQGYDTLELFLENKVPGEYYTDAPTDLEQVIGNLQGEFLIAVDPDTGAVGIRGDFPEATHLFGPLGGMRRFNVEGKKIVSSNANKEENRTAKWLNPKKIDVIVIPGNSFNLINLIGAIAGFLTVGGIAIWIRNLRTGGSAVRRSTPRPRRQRGTARQRGSARRATRRR